MQQFDFTLLFIWYLVPFTLLGLKAALASYRARKKKAELREIEGKITPFAREL
jgi:hypothetical protein